MPVCGVGRGVEWWAFCGGGGGGSGGGGGVAAFSARIGFPSASNVRVGKTIELDIDGDAATAEKQAKDMAERLLANTVIESYRVEVG